MTPQLSLYLDLLRIGAAGLVFISHFCWPTLGGYLARMEPYGHSGVILFLVLSGFVIAYTTDARECGARSFFVNRLARLWSVALPALILTNLVDPIGMALDPSIYNAANHADPLGRSLLAFTFTNELWSIRAMPLSATPFWSLPYEFWAYVLFGLVAVARARWRWAAALLVAVAVGPKILLYLPIWLSGVAVYRWRTHPLPRRQALVLFASTPILGLALAALSAHLRATGTPWLPEEFSLLDYPLTLLMAAHIHAAAVVLPTWPRVLVRPIRFAAGRTFSLYLFHAPLLHLGAALLVGLPHGPLKAGLVALAGLLPVPLLALIGEDRKAAYRRVLTRVADMLQARHPRLAPRSAT